MSLTFSAIGLCLLFSLLVLEFHVAVMHDGTSQLVNAILLLLSKAQNIKGILKKKRGIIFDMSLIFLHNFRLYSEVKGET